MVVRRTPSKFLGGVLLRPGKFTESKTMSNLRLSDTRFGDGLESAMRRFFSPTTFESAAGTLLRNERYQGSVSRTFCMVQDIDDARGNAKFQDGVLILELPKKARQASHKIAVQ
jgi:hypothetical protein